MRDRDQVQEEVGRGALLRKGAECGAEGGGWVGWSFDLGLIILSWGNEKKNQVPRINLRLVRVRFFFKTNSKFHERIYVRKSI